MIRKHLLAAGLAMLFTVSSAQAALIAPGAAGGSEGIASFVNTATGSTISFDIGEQVAGIAAGDFYALPAPVLSFINAAGGAGNVTFALILGNTVTRQYLTSSDNDTFAETAFIGNGARTAWAANLNELVDNLNLSGPPGSPTAQNDTYGPFAAGVGSPNYLDGFHNNWGSNDSVLNNNGSGAGPLFLYRVAFSTANSGQASVTAFGGATPLLARLTLGPSSGIQISAVPVPAGVWLLGTALLPLARRFARRTAQPAAA